MSGKDTETGSNSGISADLAAFRAKFRLDDLTLAEAGGWVLSLRPEQITAGAMVLSAASGVQDLARLTPEEGAGLAAGLSLAERLARDRLGAVRINVLCLMMQDPVVHFHILPRYDAPVRLAGRTWEDAAWPGPPAIGPAPTAEATLAALMGRLAPGARP
ncbi:HIT family protein [Jannaschia marina]|uniref:HIT family protein n=1 Tax=Jannaschia marina TaxID=2741674 RepID=UPI0015C886EA|nr:HIT family protein [Jannaschia marina]